MQNPWLNGVPKGRDYPVLIESSEFKELVTLCDRCLVLRNGRLVAELHRDNLTEQSLMQAALLDT